MKKIIAGLIILFFINNLAAKAELLNYSGILDQSVKNSFKLKISKLDVNISQKDKKIAKSDYYPNLKFVFNNQYDRDLAKSGASLSSVGETIMSNASQYQDAASFSLSYVLYDFGVRKNKLIYADKNIIQKQVVYEKTLRDLKVAVLDCYSEALIFYKEWKAKEQMLTLQREVYKIQQELFKQGKNSKIEASNEAIDVVNLENNIDNLKNNLDKKLKELSYYTKKDYLVSDVQLEDIVEDELIPVSNKQTPDEFKLGAVKKSIFEETPEYKAYQLEIEKKKAELKILKNQTLPQFGFSTGYNFYGSDMTSYTQAFNNLKERSMSFRVYSQLQLFDGFKNKAQQEQANLQIEKLALQRDEEVDNFKSYLNKTSSEVDLYTNKLKNDRQKFDLAKDRLSMIKRLNDEKLIDKINLLKQKSKFLDEKLQLEITMVKNITSSYKLKTLSEVKK